MFGVEGFVPIPSVDPWVHQVPGGTLFAPGADPVELPGPSGLWVVVWRGYGGSDGRVGRAR